MNSNRLEYFDNITGQQYEQLMQNASPNGWFDLGDASIPDCIDRNSIDFNSGLSDHCDAGYTHIDHADDSPGHGVQRESSPYYPAEEQQHPLNASLLVSFTSNHGSPVDLAAIDHGYRSGSMDLGSGHIVNTPVSSMSEHDSRRASTSPRDSAASMSMSTSMSMSMPMSWAPQNTAPSQDTSMMLHASANSVAAPSPFFPSMSHSIDAMQSASHGIFDIHYTQPYGQIGQNNDVPFPIQDLSTWNTDLSVIPQDSYGAFTNVPPQPAPPPPQLQNEMMNDSILTHPMSNRASSASSPHTDYVIIESRRDMSSRKRKSSSKAGSSQAHMPGVTVFRLSPSSTSESERSQISDNRTGKKPRGGRQKGMQLSNDKKQQVKERREMIACWICALQRDVCYGTEPGQPCNRCAKRLHKSMSPGSNELACVAEHLYAYVEEFVPTIFDRLHNSTKLQEFMEQHIKKFCGTDPIRISIDPTRGGITIDCVFREFEPEGQEVLITREGVHIANKYVYTVKRNLPLSLMELTDVDERRFDEYFDGLAQNRHYMETFPGICYEDPPDDFLKKLMSMMMSYVPEGKKETAFINSVNKMLLLMYSFGRACLIPVDQRHQFAKLRQGAGIDPASIDALPRMANRQLKFLFLRLLRTALERVLKSLDNMFRSSKGSWTTAFYGMLGLAMAFEDMENSVAIYLQTDQRTNVCTAELAESQLLSIANAIDNKFRFLHKLFLAKYKSSPFDYGRAAQGERRRHKLGEEGARLVLDVQKLMREKFKSHLRFQQSVSVTMANPEAYYGRLVAQFLCSFLRLG